MNACMACCNSGRCCAAPTWVAYVLLALAADVLLALVWDADVLLVASWDTGVLSAAATPALASAASSDAVSAVTAVPRRTRRAILSCCLLRGSPAAMAEVFMTSTIADHPDTGPSPS
ncbi:hypothetical protein GCM10009850_040950 [Nonomuraea monospora]|uniref:Secreted protein n=1 Tax=Nonomuraea monospora TaxID=568818 RepID=A0ABN3CHE1_9ACTN